jgi:hypothetical protein
VSLTRKFSFLVSLALVAQHVAATVPLEVMGTPESLSPKLCRVYLESDGPADDQTEAKADEVLAWLTGHHPLWIEAMKNAHSLSYLYDLAHLPVGFALPPPENTSWFKKSGVLKRFDEVVGFETSLYSRGDKPYRQMQAKLAESCRRSRDWIVMSWNLDGFVSEKIKFASDYLAHSLVLLQRLTAPGAWWAQSQAEHRELRIMLRLAGDTRVINLKWPRSFDDRQIKELTTLRENFENPKVIARVFKRYHDNLRRHVINHMDLLAHLDKVERIDDPRRAVLVSEALASIRGPHTLVRAIPRASAASMLPPPPAASFDLNQISEFVRDTTWTPTTRPADVDFSVNWHELLRAGALTAGLLDSLRHSPDAGTWLNWLKLIRPGNPWTEQLLTEVGRATARSAKVGRELRESAQAIASLRGWLDRRVDGLRGLESSAERLSELSPHDQRTYSASLEYVPHLALLLENAEQMIARRRDLNFERSRHLSDVTLTIGAVTLARAQSDDFNASTRAENRVIEILTVLAESE